MNSFFLTGLKNKIKHTCNSLQIPPDGFRVADYDPFLFISGKMVRENYFLSLLSCFYTLSKVAIHALSSFQFSCSVMSDFLWPHGPQHIRPPCLSPPPRIYPNSVFNESVMPSNHLILCRPLLLSPSIPPSIRVFSSESALHIRWPKYWSFSFSISPSNEHLGLTSFRMDWLDLLAVQGTVKSLLQHHSSKASILRCSAFFTVQLSHPYMTTGKTIALTRRTFVGKVMSLLFKCCLGWS